MEKSIQLSGFLIPGLNPFLIWRSGQSLKTTQQTLQKNILTNDMARP